MKMRNGNALNNGNKLRRVVSNTIISLFGQLVTWTSTLLLTIAYGRYLGDVKFGELYFAVIFVQLIGFPVDVGFDQQVSRDVAQVPEKALRYLANTLLIKLIFWVVLYSFIIVLSWLIGYDSEERMLVIICGLTLLCTAFTNTVATIHFAYERAVFPVVGSILEKGLGALIGILLLRNGANVEIMAVVLLGSSMINTLWQSTWFFRLVGMKFAIDWTLIRQLLKTSIPFLISGVLSVIYYRIDTVMLSIMTTVAVVGWYGAGYRIFDTLLFIANVILKIVLFPVLSKLSVTSEESLKLAIEKSLNFLLFCGIPIAVILMTASAKIVGFLYHRPEFTNTVPVLVALAPGLVFLYINIVLGAVVVISKRERKIPIIAAAALVFNLGLNIILIPQYRHVGAAIVTSLTELLLVCLNVAFTPRQLLPIRSIRVGIKAIIAGLVMALVIQLLTALSIFVILPIALAVYLVVALLLGTIPREDILAIYNAIRFRSTQPGDVASVDLQSDKLEMYEEWPINEKTPFMLEYGVKLDDISSSDYQQEEYEDVESQITEKRPSIRVMKMQPVDISSDCLQEEYEDVESQITKKRP